MALSFRQRKVLDALIATNGNVAQATNAAKVARTTHYEWVKKCSEYAKAYRSLEHNKGSLAKQAKEAAIRARCKVGETTVQYKKQGVYVLHCEGTSYYKIGRTSIGLYNRVSAVQSGCPFKINVVYFGYVKNAAKVEGDLHASLSAQNVRGEWFDLTAKDLERVVGAIAEAKPKALTLF